MISTYLSSEADLYENKIKTTKPYYQRMISFTFKFYYCFQQQKIPAINNCMRLFDNDISFFAI